MALPQENIFSKEKFSDLYKLGAKLGEGHFGVVREVAHKATGQVFATKIILKTPNQQQQSDPSRNRLQSEAELSLELTRANPGLGLVSTVQAFEDEQRVYLVMEHCSGGTLADYIERRRDSWRREIETARESGKKFGEIEEIKRERREKVEVEAGWIFGELAAALAHVHERGVIHRDMKPENVLLSQPVGAGEWVSGLASSSATNMPRRQEKPKAQKMWGKVLKALKNSKVRPSLSSDRLAQSQTSEPNMVKIADFGLAERITPGGAATSGLVGSPAYVAPELVLSQPVGSPADMWGLGVILYFLLSEGKLPFSGRSTALLFRNIRRASIDLSSPALIGASADAKAVLVQLLSADPTARPSAADVAEMPWVKEQMRRREEMIRRQE